MNKRFILVALLATILFMGAYLAWTTWISPRPPVVAQEAVPAVTPNPTIIPATLNKDGIPEQLGSLKLTRSSAGKDALQEFQSLHGEEFDLLGGYKADYEGADAKATLWVGQAKHAAAAQAMVKQMADKIGPNNEMFADLTEFAIKERTIYQAIGQGQSHFFYAANDKIIWLAASPDYAPDALHSMWSVVK